MPALVLNTIERKSGELRRTRPAHIPDGQGNCLIVAAYAGAVNNPAWYYNIAAPPIVAANNRFTKYQEKTDRLLPAIRLTPGI